MTHTHGRVVLDSADISRALTRLAHEILERTQGGENVTLMGIPTRGVALANRLAARINEIQGSPVPVGSIMSRCSVMTCGCVPHAH